MALYSVDIEKRLGSEFWSNRYIVNADSLAVARTAAETIVNDVEIPIHNSNVTFTRFRVSTMAEGDETYVIVPINQNGAVVSNSTLLPLFNTLRWDISAATGRPSRKFYRGVLTEADINGDAVTWTAPVGAVAALAALFGTGEATGTVVDPQGTTLTGVTQYPFVQMRQLRRSRRRRTNGDGIFQ